MMFQFNYILTEDDYINFNFHHALHTKPGKKRVLFSRFFVVCFFILILFISWIQERSALLLMIQAVPLTIFSILWIAFYEKIMLRIIRKNIHGMKKSGRLPYSERGTFTFGEQFMCDNAGSVEGKVSYDLVEAIYTTNDAIYIYYNTIAAYLLPYRCIESQETFQNFLNFLQAKTNNPIIHIS